MKIRKFLFPLAIVSMVLFQITGCGSIKHVPVNNDTQVHIRDSVVFKDSVILRDSIIFTEIPREKDMDMVSWKDSSFLETTVATSSAFIDTTSHTIKHTLKNKEISLEKEIVYIDRIKYKDKIIYRDSIVTEQVPYPVEVEKRYIPKWVWFSLIFNILVVIYVGLKIYFKFKKI